MLELVIAVAFMFYNAEIKKWINKFGYSSKVNTNTRHFDNADNVKITDKSALKVGEGSLLSF